MDRPLKGIRVIEMGIVVAGPAAAAIMSDWGAEVIKIEPVGGDPQRSIFQKFSGSSVAISPPFDTDNRGKQSIVLDLKTSEGQEVLEKLMGTADVFVTNYRQRALAEIGKGYAAEQLIKRFPSLIICVISGFGIEGPDKDKPGYDIAAFWARSGLGSSCTPEGEIPYAISGGAGDHMTAVAAVSGVCASLLARAKTGKGQVVDASLLRVGLYANAWDTATYMNLGHLAPKPTRFDTFNPMLNSYSSKDKKMFWLLGLESDRHWPPTAKAANLEHLIKDPRFANAKQRRKNSKNLVELLDASFGSKTFEELKQIFEKFDVWWTPIQNVKEVVNDPQAIAAKAFVEIPASLGDKPIKSMASPVNFSSFNTNPTGPVPKIGEHTKKILLDLGYSPDVIPKFLSKL